MFCNVLIDVRALVAKFPIVLLMVSVYLNKRKDVKDWLHDATLHSILRAIVSLKCRHPLNFNEIIARNVAKVVSDFTSAIMQCAFFARNDFKGGNTMLFSRCTQYCVQLFQSGKSSHPLKFGEIVVRNVAKVELDFISAILRRALLHAMISTRWQHDAI